MARRYLAEEFIGEGSGQKGRTGAKGQPLEKQGRLFGGCGRLGRRVGVDTVATAVFMANGVGFFAAIGDVYFSSKGEYALAHECF